MIGFIAAFFTIITNYNSSQSRTVYDSFYSLLDYECLLFQCDWLCAHLQIGHFFSFSCQLVSTPQLNTELLNCFWSLLRMTASRRNWTLTNELNWTLELIMCHPVITLRRTEYRSPSQTVPLLLSVFPLLRNLPGDIIPTNRGPSTVDCATLGTCLPYRCLAMVVFVTVLYSKLDTNTCSSPTVYVKRPHVYFVNPHPHHIPVYSRLIHSNTDDIPFWNFRLN
jgi:hypothetical protein